MDTTPCRFRRSRCARATNVSPNRCAYELHASETIPAVRARSCMRAALLEAETSSASMARAAISCARSWAPRATPSSSPKRNARSDFATVSSLFSLAAHRVHSASVAATRSSVPSTCGAKRERGRACVRHGEKTEATTPRCARVHLFMSPREPRCQRHFLPKALCAQRCVKLGALTRVRVMQRDQPRASRCELCSCRIRGRLELGARCVDRS